MPFGLLNFVSAFETKTAKRIFHPKSPSVNGKVEQMGSMHEYLILAKEIKFA